MFKALLSINLAKTLESSQISATIPLYCAIYNKTLLSIHILNRKSSNEFHCKCLPAYSLLPSCSVQKWQVRGAGHSKWSNIKDVKGAKDRMKGLVVSRLSTQIKFAIKVADGNVNPVSNPRLGKIFDEAAQLNIPKANIMKIVEKCQKINESGKQYHLEYQGLNGICMVIEVFTDNIKRAKSSVNGAVRKFGCKEGKHAGSLRHMFHEKAMITTSTIVEDKEITHSQAVDHAIEAGAEDVEQHEDMFQFQCSFRDMHIIQSSLCKMGYNVTDCLVEFVPKNPIQLDDAAQEPVTKMLAKLDDVEDVVNVYTNISE